MVNNSLNLDYLFESSWEVCNKVGGIYTVLSTRARTLQSANPDKVFFLGPDLWSKDNPAIDFVEDKTLYASWCEYAKSEDEIKVRIGRWQVPGNPIVFLIDFKPFFNQRDILFAQMWEDFKVDSMHAYGDYDESCIFAYAVAKTIESFYRFNHLESKRVVAHFNEWMLGMSSLYLHKNLPKIATLFTTHATSIGRSIAGNDKPLYTYMEDYNGDQMAKELHMEAKHSLEKQAAHYADCFTTVSDITAVECEQLLEKKPDVVTPNGFEPGFVPVKSAYTKKRHDARTALIKLAEKLTGSKIDKSALLISTSGRYEYRNKGLDVFIEAMNRVRLSNAMKREAVAFILVPSDVKEARADLATIYKKDIKTDQPMQMPFATHWLNHMEDDKILRYIQHLGFTNSANEKLKIIYVPTYLSGNDGILDMPYYDLLVGMDVTVYPSYYEPWGYTPLESVAFGIPTITTNLAGFGLWAKKFISGNQVKEGVSVVERTDSNYFEVAESVAKAIIELSKCSGVEYAKIRRKCRALANKAEWKNFISYYQQAYQIAFENKLKK